MKTSLEDIAKSQSHRHKVDGAGEGDEVLENYLIQVRIIVLHIFQYLQRMSHSCKQVEKYEIWKFKFNRSI